MGVDGDVNVPDGYPHCEWVTNSAYTRLIKASARLVNETAGACESGFWVSPTCFFSALHFNNWNVLEYPTYEELKLFSEPFTHELWISDQPYVPGSTCLDRARKKVYCAGVLAGTDVGVFTIYPNQSESRYFIDLEDCISDRYQPGDRVMAVGYNSHEADHAEWQVERDRWAYRGGSKSRANLVHNPFI